MSLCLNKFNFEDCKYQKNKIPLMLELPVHFGIGPSYPEYCRQPCTLASRQVLWVHQWSQVLPLLQAENWQLWVRLYGHNSIKHDRNSVVRSNAVLYGLIPIIFYAWMIYHFFWWLNKSCVWLMPRSKRNTWIIFK